MLHIGNYTCRKICLNIVYINFEHSNNSIQWNHISLSFFSPINKNCLPFFVNDLHLEIKVNFELGNIYFHFGTINTSFILLSFRYNVWIFMNFFFQMILWMTLIILKYMNIIFMIILHIHIVFAYNISTTNFGKVNWQHLTHCNWKGNLLVSRSHIHT